MFVLRRIYQMYRCFTFALRTYLLCSYNNTGPMVLVEAKEHPVHPLKLNFCKSLNQGELHLDRKCASHSKLLQKLHGLGIRTKYELGSRNFCKEGNRKFKCTIHSQNVS